MRVELEVESLAKGGDAVAHLQGQVVFLDRAAPGDTVIAEVDAVRAPASRALQGRVLEVVKPGPSRVTPACPVADRCGGCGWMHLDYAEQVTWKERLFYDALERIGRIPRSELGERALPVVCPTPPLAYRRRATLHIRKGEVGYLGAQSHRLVPVSTCPILDPVLDRAVGQLSTVLGDTGLASRATEIALLAEGEAWSFSLQVDRLTGALRERAERAARALGARGAVLETGEGQRGMVGEPELGGLRPDLFAQVSAAGNAALVERALEWLRPAPGMKVLELFSGSGNFTLPVAEAGAEVWAIEESLPAVNLCRTRAGSRPEASRVHLLVGDAMKRAHDLVSEGLRFDALLADPPRAGCAGIGALCRALGIARAVMVSCDPATLARDAAELKGAGLRPLAAQPLDLFPQTPHLEGMMLFERP